MERTERAIYVSALALIITAAICTSVIVGKPDEGPSSAVGLDSSDLSSIEFTLGEIQSALAGELDVQVTNTVDVSGSVDVLNRVNVSGTVDINGEVTVTNSFLDPLWVTNP